MNAESEHQPQVLRSLLIFLVLLVAVGALGYGIYKMLIAPSKKQPGSAIVQSVTPSEESGLSEEASYERDEEQGKQLQRAKETILTLVKVRSAEEVVPLIAGGEEIREEILAYLKEHPMRKGRVIQTETQPIDGDVLLRSTVVNDSGNWFEINIPLKTGLIDWGSFSGKNLGNEAEILKMAQEPDGVPVRVVLNFGPQNSYYNYEFVDDKKWRACRATHPDFDHDYWVYVERGGLADQQLKDALLTDSGRVTMVLRLKAASDKVTTTRQMEVLSMESVTWFLSGGLITQAEGKQQ